MFLVQCLDAGSKLQKLDANICYLKCVNVLGVDFFELARNRVNISLGLALMSIRSSVCMLSRSKACFFFFLFCKVGSEHSSRRVSFR